MSTPTSFTFTAPLKNTDGTPINEPLTYSVLVDTVTPPKTKFSVPAAEVTAAVGGVINVTFAQLGFVPVNGTTYFAAADDTDASGTSALSNIVTFTYTVSPGAPTGFSAG